MNGIDALMSQTHQLGGFSLGFMNLIFETELENDVGAMLGLETVQFGFEISHLFTNFQVMQAVATDTDARYGVERFGFERASPFQKHGLFERVADVGFPT